jgi:preprotein translocase subunit SecE
VASKAGWHHRKEGEVADSNRGERSVDDELDDVFSTDDDLSTGDTAARGRSRTRSVVAQSRPVARTKAKGERGPGLVGRLVHFVREVVAELQKVIWPTRKELLTYTAVVLVFVTVMMSFVAALDLAFAKTMFVVFGGKTNQ